MAFKKIGILSIGEMGYYWACTLRSRGVEVLTSLDGRSAVTRKRAENAGVKALALTELVREADLIVSVVVPSAAKRVATRVAQALAKTGRGDLTYLEANAISPMTALDIGQILERAVLIDGCIIGSASKLTEGATVYISGPQAERINALEKFGLSVRVIGPSIGQASAFKIIYAGLTKGLQSLLTELLIGAKRLGVLDEILSRYDESYPGLAQKVGHSIAALPVHAARRAEEMAELAETFRHYGLTPVMAPAAERILRAIGDLKVGEASEQGSRRGSLADTLELFSEKALLQNKKSG
jgi:3-hydroxyisobutyrate dehydrogenase-like beta-hydroxyacid dehydrogenase